ncbi:uncharacterized protein LOC136025822 [Artemia franciscana]|uniref:uncharacterized protein LOC136025822 n=1 Tax=Artemia franciscana TaxID=6661 RepID=UPI0032DBC392
MRLFKVLFRRNFIFFFVITSIILLFCFRSAYKEDLSLNEDAVEYLKKNIIPPYTLEDAWNFETPLNRNFTALEYFLATLDQPWIDIILILDLFFPTDKKRFFVECGGADGELFGNSIFLEKFKFWNGLLIEADPYYFKELLVKKRKAYAIQACLSSSNSSYITSFQHEDPLAENKDTNFIMYNKGNGRVLYNEEGHNGYGKDEKGFFRLRETVKVSCFPFWMILHALDVTTVDVLFLDVEGGELNILKTIPFAKLSISAILVEYDGRKDYLQKIESFLTNIGYELFNLYSNSWTNGDALFLRRTFRDEYRYETVHQYDKRVVLNISDDKIRDIIFRNTDSESSVKMMINLRNLILYQ